MALVGLVAVRLVRVIFWGAEKESRAAMSVRLLEFEVRESAPMARRERKPSEPRFPKMVMSACKLDIRAGLPGHRMCREKLGQAGLVTTSALIAARLFETPCTVLSGQRK